MFEFFLLCSDNLQVGCATHGDIVGKVINNEKLQINISTNLPKNIKIGAFVNGNIFGTGELVNSSIYDVK